MFSLGKLGNVSRSIVSNKSKFWCKESSSGHVQSTHYKDQVELFLKGSYRNLNFKDEQVQNQQIAQLKLLPL